LRGWKTWKSRSGEHRTEEAVDLTSRDHPNVAVMLSNLGNKLGMRFEKIGRMEDLEQSPGEHNKRWISHLKTIRI